MYFVYLFFIRFANKPVLNYQNSYLATWLRGKTWSTNLNAISLFLFLYTFFIDKWYPFHKPSLYPFELL